MDLNEAKRNVHYYGTRTFDAETHDLWLTAKWAIVEIERRDATTCDDCQKPFSDCRCGAESVCVPHGSSLSSVIANNVRKERESQGITQSDLATACKLQTSAISHIECGRRTPTIATLKKIAKRLGVSMDSLCEEVL